MFLPEGKSIPKTLRIGTLASADGSLKYTSSGSDPPGSCDCKVFPWNTGGDVTSENHAKKSGDFLWENRLIGGSI